MKDKFSKRSLLRQTLTNEEKPIVAIMDDAVTNLRAMCRLMQVFNETSGVFLKDAERDLADVQAALSAFYEFVDYQMDQLSELVDAIEEVAPTNLSVADLRDESGAGKRCHGSACEA